VANHFDYLISRIVHADVAELPFPHLHLKEFLHEDDFDELTQSADVRLPPAADLEELFGHLDRAGYRAVDFPGCTSSREEYTRWIAEQATPKKTHKACESQGMALRNVRMTSPLTVELDEFFRSQEFLDAARAKFDITAPTEVDAGLQKYLHGYEISPHPDVRHKALTWMLNVNPDPRAADQEFHTHYMTFKPEWSFIGTLWEHNPKLETCWVPWDWCSTAARQRDNNSLVMFSPRWDTLHAVKAHYDHLPSQRTQFYGNLWYAREPNLLATKFHDFDLVGRASDGLAARGLVPKAKAAAVKVQRLLRRDTGLAPRRL